MLDVLHAFRGKGGIERDFLAAHAATGGSRIICIHGGTPPLTDKGGECRRRHWLGEQEALSRIARRLPQQCETGWRFHALGHHVHAQPVRKLNDGAHDGSVAVVVGESGDEGLVDLSVVIGQHFRCCRQEYPVPKSSAAKRTPICRKASRAGKIAGSPERDRFGQLDFKRLGGQLGVSQHALYPSVNVTMRSLPPLSCTTRLRLSLKRAAPCSTVMAGLPSRMPSYLA
ncbi:hypothetical protein OURE66S_02618 [Oligella ureolytica]